MRRSLLRLKGIESGQALIGPATVQLDLTNVCDMACRFCHHFAPDSPYLPVSENNLSFEHFKSIIKDCRELQVDMINLSGIGEPTMHPEFYKMLEHIEGSFEVIVTSSATFPKERCMDILRADCIIINLAEADRAGYQALHGRDRLLRVAGNIRELARLRSEFNPDFRIEVVFVETNLNAGSFSRTENLARRLGADNVYKQKFFAGDHTEDILLPEQRWRTGIQSEWPACYHGWFYSSIKLNGDVNVCTFLRRVNIGNVFKCSFKQVWMSDEYSRARRSALTGDPFRSFHECINCSLSARNKAIGVQRDIYNRSLKS